jgi:hypothetical protein
MTSNAGRLRAAEASLNAADPVRGKDVTVGKLFRARCHRPGCCWAGGDHLSYQDANTERLAHLNQHILAGGQR